MAMAELSPTSVLASPIQVNPQVTNDLQTSVPQAAQDARKFVTGAQTDTITISAQALKMADDKNFAARATAGKADEQEASNLARDKADSELNETQRNAVKAYAALSVG